MTPFNRRKFLQTGALSLLPALLPFTAAKAGGTSPAVLNAANEVAVAAFLEDGLPYLSIPKVVEHCLNALPSSSADSLETILEADVLARQAANQFVRSRQK